MIPSRVMDILRSVGEKPQLPPTIIYNEGWMLRLVLDAFDCTRSADHPLSFSEGASWFSEANLPTAFKPRLKVDRLSESYTHADGVIGHIQVDSSGRGYLGLAANAAQFVVVEAKMFSRLSVGVRNAPTFHQAARSVACMAELLRRNDRPPSGLDDLGFYVLAPREVIEADVFRLQTRKESIRVAVDERVASYGGGTARWYDDWFTPLMERIKIECFSWESVLETIEPLGVGGRGELAGFYRNCLRFNRPKQLAK